MEEELFEAFASVRRASRLLAASPDSERKLALSRIREALLENKTLIEEENRKDLETAEASNLSSSLLHRLHFSQDKVASLSKGLQQLALLPDPIGKAREKRELAPGLVLEKRTFPIGVIGMIFESRPDALVQIASLALRSGNGIILKGGKEALHTNRALVSIIQGATQDLSFGKEWIMGLESHSDVDALLKAEGYVDLLIPRGSNSFVKHVMDNTRIPVIGHADGICAVYVDSSANLEKAVKVAVDSKTQYPAACNAAETILVARSIASSFLPLFELGVEPFGVKIHADEESARYLSSCIPATEEDYHTEYLGMECAVKTVEDVQEAVAHIEAHGSHHTDAVVAEDRSVADYFVRFVDSADVFVNASTRFADGFRFGLGAEVGIATSKLHARGPVGLDGLMTTKWVLQGSGDCVAEFSGENAREYTHRELEA